MRLKSACSITALRAGQISKFISALLSPTAPCRECAKVAPLRHAQSQGDLAAEYKTTERSADNASGHNRKPSTSRTRAVFPQPGTSHSGLPFGHEENIHSRPT